MPSAALGNHWGVLTIGGLIVYIYFGDFKPLRQQLHGSLQILDLKS